MMHSSLARLAALAVASLSLGGRGALAQSARPNVVLFVSDDQRHDHLSCAGHPVLRTPELDRLAARGVRFRRAFVTTSICAASRATLLTGLYERAHRYTFGRPPIAARDARIAYPAALRDAGYRTGFVGKFGVRVEGGGGALFESFRPMPARPYFAEGADGRPRHISDRIGDAAVDFVRARGDARPFCLSVSFHAGHADDGDKERHYKYAESEARLYEGVELPAPRLAAPEVFDAHPEFLKRSMNRERFFWRWDTPEKYARNLRAYYRMLSGMDRVVGRVLRALEGAGLADDTVVLFVGDNGYYMGQRGFAGKWTHYDESLRVPLIVADPRVAPEKRGRVVDALALGVDVPATILALAGVPVPKRYQGRSLAAHVAGADAGEPRRDFFCEHLMHRPPRRGTGRGAIPKWEGVRSERWSYASYFEQDPPFEFLHDLEQDPDQLVNLAGARGYATQLERMRARCAELRFELGPSLREGPQLANGFKLGEVDARSVQVVARLTRDHALDVRRLYARGEAGARVVDAMPEDFSVGSEGELRVRYWPRAKPAEARATAWRAVEAARDYTQRFELGGLAPATDYELEVEARAAGATRRSARESGSFRTAPAERADVALRFQVATCQAILSVDDARFGHRTYADMLRMRPDFFVHTGDAVYYDKKPLAKTVPAARAKWHAMFSYADARAFFRHVPSFFLKDDHDTLKNDCWPGQRYGALRFEDGLAIHREQLPRAELPYRTRRWGEHAQLWFLDTREFRSSNRAPDGPDKTLLGAAQLAWLRDGLAASDASFKIVVSPGPIVGPDKRGKADNHANAAFAHEGRALRRLLAATPNCYVICGDRHWQYCSRDPQSGLVELGCGPIHDRHDFGGAPPEDPRVHEYFARGGGWLRVEVDASALVATWFRVGDSASGHAVRAAERLRFARR